MSKRRLIEDWLPIAALSEECVRERRSMTALPPTYYLHVWFARRPLVASRAAILGCQLPADSDRGKFLHDLGIHGDPVKTKERIARAKITGEDLGSDPYGYPRAFQFLPPADGKRSSVLDPTAGGGSIPFEAVRLNSETIANDLNPVAALLLRTTVELPLQFGADLLCLPWMAISGHGLSPARTAAGSCRCRRTGSSIAPGKLECGWFRKTAAYALTSSTAKQITHQAR